MPKVRNPSFEKEAVHKVAVSVECPKVYGNSLSLGSCKKCQFFQTLENGKVICAYTPNGDAKIHPKNKLNELKGNEWLYFTKTVLRTSFPSKYGHQLRKKHYANKPPQLMKYIIEFFTKSNEVVLDPFAGVGGTLIGASLCGRKALGIEINPEWVNIYHQVCETQNIPPQKMIQGNCLEEMLHLRDNSKKFDAIITDPPYSPALEKTLCDGKYGWARRTSNFESFSENPKDFRNSESFSTYFEKIEEAAVLISELLKEKGYLIMMLRDSYQNQRYIPTSFLVASRLEKYFTLKGVKIWHQTGAPVRPYGYPFSYVPNIVHHDILIFKKEM
ncbi:MAG: DNA methyltransferase [Candidatus Helarchaeota archaeon]